MPRADKTQDGRVVVYKGEVYECYDNPAYTRYSGYHKLRRDQHQEPLHRQVYIDNFGPIPEGYHVHHKDGNTWNNSPDNLVAISPADHMKETMSQRWEHPIKRVCESCGKVYDSISNKSRFCSKTCCHREWRRKNADKVNAYIRERRKANATSQ